MQIGGHGGYAVPTRPEPAKLIQGADAMAYITPLNRGFWPHVGVEGAAEVEHQGKTPFRPYGTFWTTGLQLGAAYAMQTQPLTIQTHLDVGVPVSGGPYDGYTGLTAALPIELTPEHNVTDMNHAFQFVSRRISIVPQLRYRLFWQDEGATHSVVFGVAFRARLATDLL